MQLLFTGSSAHDTTLGTRPVLSQASGVTRNDHNTGTRSTPENSAIFTGEAANDNTLINLGQNLGGRVESHPTSPAGEPNTGGVTDERDSTGGSSTIMFRLHLASRAHCSGFASQHRCNSLFVDERPLLADVRVESMTWIPDLTDPTVAPSSAQNPGCYGDTLGGGW